MARPLPDILRCAWPGEPAEPPPLTLAALDRAAAVLRSGGLVAIPTETVYGLAADALDEFAVDRIFRAKGRPATNPLIVHVADVAMARSLAAAWPPAAEALTAALWPGPLTVVVPRGDAIPDVVTGGGTTVALRCPAHPLARLLIARSGIPLAAPSANRSEMVSPTTAHHVLEGLGDRVDLILDGGRCDRGIESTVVDCTVSPPRILRPGPLARAALEAALGGRVLGPGSTDDVTATGPARAPGTRPRHYAPRTRLDLRADAAAHIAALLAQGRRVGWMTTHDTDPAVRELAASRDLVIVPMPGEPTAFAAALYATLHALDRRGLDRIVVDEPAATEEWQAIRDRLGRAAARGSPDAASGCGSEDFP
jgi:L-threonylcarbamoyladenylate synthase